MNDLKLMVTKANSVCWSLMLLVAFSCQEPSLKVPDCGLCSETGAEWLEDEKPLPAYDSLFK
jgi:hypothetical protein